MWTLVYFSTEAGGWRAARTLHCPPLRGVGGLVEDEGDESQINREE